MNKGVNFDSKPRLDWFGCHLCFFRRSTLTKSFFSKFDSNSFGRLKKSDFGRTFDFIGDSLNGMD